MRKKMIEPISCSKCGYIEDEFKAPFFCPDCKKNGEEIPLEIAENKANGLKNGR